MGGRDVEGSQKMVERNDVSGADPAQAGEPAQQPDENAAAEPTTGSGWVVVKKAPKAPAKAAPAKARAKSKAAKRKSATYKKPVTHKKTAKPASRKTARKSAPKGASRKAARKSGKKKKRA